jgi:hypothetical protein
MQFDWKVLGEKVRTYPAETTASAIFDDITAKTINHAVDVNSRDVRAALYARGAWAPIVKKANAAISGQDTSDVAVACQMLVDIANADNETADDKSRPLLQRCQTISQRLVNASVITADDASAVSGARGSQ